METFAERASVNWRRAADEGLESDRFVKPARTSPLHILKFDSLAFAAAQGFEAIELSPLAPLSTNTAVAPMSQKKVLSTIRSSEVAADSTNVMALELAVRRRQLLKEDAKSSAVLRLAPAIACARAEVSRRFYGAFSCFRSACWTRSTGSFQFEIEAMAEHADHLFYSRRGSRLSQVVERSAWICTAATKVLCSRFPQKSG